MQLTDSRTRQRQAAVTLTEFLVSMGIGALVVLVLVPLILWTNRSFASLTNYIDLNSRSLNALDQITRDIRKCVSLTEYSETQLVFNDGKNPAALTLTYDPLNRTLVRERDGNRTTLLTECDLLQFSIYQRTPLPGTYDQYPPATTDDCKVVAIKWGCSRTLFGRKATTESGQQAKIVMRNH